MKISVILEKKHNRHVVTIRPDTTLETALHYMKTEKIGCLVVSLDGKSPVGILSARDVVYGLGSSQPGKGLLYGTTLRETPVSEIMTNHVETCTPDDTLKDVMGKMLRWHYLHVPVVNDGVLCGVISIDDVVRFGVEQMEMEANVLRDTLIRRGV